MSSSFNANRSNERGDDRSHAFPRRVLLMASSMRVGGSEQQVALLARHLPREQFEVHLYLSHCIGELLSEIPPDVQVHSPEFSGEANAPSSFAWQRWISRFPGMMLRQNARWFAELCQQKRIDVVYDRAFHNTMIAGHPSIRLKANRVSTIVSPPDRAVPMVEKRFVAAKRRLLAGAYQRSQRIIAVSDAVADSAASYYGIDRAKMTVIANPVDRQRILSLAGRKVDSKVDHYAAEVSKPKRELTLVCVGRMTSEKGQADLIEAIAITGRRWPHDSPGLRVRFVGDGPDRSSLENRIKDIADHDGRVGKHRFEFAGAISPAIPEIAAADALVLPSRFEGMPNVVLEAFVLGVPVVATRSGGTVQLETDESHPTCFWAEPGEPLSLAEALIAMATDPRERTERVFHANQLISRNHNLAAFVREMSQILMV